MNADLDYSLEILEINPLLIMCVMKNRFIFSLFVGCLLIKEKFKIVSFKIKLLQKKGKCLPGKVPLSLKVLISLDSFVPGVL